LAALARARNAPPVVAKQKQDAPIFFGHP